MPRTPLSRCCLAEAHTQKQICLSHAGPLSLCPLTGSPMWLRNIQVPFLTQAGAGNTFQYVWSLSQQVCSPWCLSEVTSHFLPDSCCTFSRRCLQPPLPALTGLHIRALSSWSMCSACKLLTQLIPNKTRLIWKQFSNPRNKVKMNWALGGPG